MSDRCSQVCVCVCAVCAVCVCACLPGGLVNMILHDVRDVIIC